MLEVTVTPNKIIVKNTEGYISVLVPTKNGYEITFEKESNERNT